MESESVMNKVPELDGDFPCLKAETRRLTRKRWDRLGPKSLGIWLDWGRLAIVVCLSLAQ